MIIKSDVNKDENHIVRQDEEKTTKRNETYSRRTKSIRPSSIIHMAFTVLNKERSLFRRIEEDRNVYIIISNN